MHKGTEAAIEVTIRINYHLPYWDKDKYGEYGTTKDEECQEIDRENVQREVEQMIDSAHSLFGFPTDELDVTFTSITEASDLEPAEPYRSSMER